MRQCLIFIAASGLAACAVDGPQTTCSTAPPALIDLPGGAFQMGSDTGYSDEGPLRSVSVAPFAISRFELTVGEFRAFVADTDYATLAEIEGGSAVFAVPNSARRSWWAWSDGASWRNPDGDGRAPADREPVRQLQMADARAYADWAGLRLPTEAEWEYAAKADETDPGQSSPAAANAHQGAFPIQDSGQDGYAGIAPVGCYPANAFGLHDMVGNVWELTSDDHPRPGTIVMKGGSFLCSDSYCRRDRPAAREAQEATLATSHAGVRLVRDDM